MVKGQWRTPNILLNSFYKSLRLRLSQKYYIIWVRLCYLAPIIETYLCDSLRFLVIPLRLEVNNSDTQTNSFISLDNCTFSLVVRFISVSDSLLFAIRQLSDYILLVSAFPKLSQ